MRSSMRRRGVGQPRAGTTRFANRFIAPERLARASSRTLKRIVRIFRFGDPDGLIAFAPPPTGRRTLSGRLTHGVASLCLGLFSFSPYGRTVATGVKGAGRGLCYPTLAAKARLGWGTRPVAKAF